jgi:hypothetical protein
MRPDAQLRSIRPIDQMMLGLAMPAFTASSYIAMI